MLTFFSFSTASRSPSSSFGMPQHASFSTTAIRNLVVREDLQQVVADPGLVVVDVAGREDRDLARRALPVAHRPRDRRRAPMSRKRRRRVGRQRRAGRDAEHLVHRLARERRRVRLVHHLHDDGNRREPADAVGARQQAVAERRLALAELRPPWRAASGAENRRSTDAAARTGTSSCSRRRTDSTGRRPCRSRPWRRRRPPSSCCRRRGRTASGTPGTGSRSGGSRGRCRRRAPAPCRATPRRRTPDCASRADGGSARRGCLRGWSSVIAAIVRCTWRGAGRRVARQRQRRVPTATTPTR